MLVGGATHRALLLPPRLPEEVAAGADSSSSSCDDDSDDDDDLAYAGWQFAWPRADGVLYLAERCEAQLERRRTRAGQGPRSGSPDGDATLRARRRLG